MLLYRFGSQARQRKPRELNAGTRAKILASLAIQFSTTADVIGRYLPQKLQEWGKLRISGDSEIVRASDHAELDPDASRDATFVRVSRCLTRLNICDLK